MIRGKIRAPQTFAALISNPQNEFIDRSKRSRPGRIGISDAYHQGMSMMGNAVQQYQLRQIGILKVSIMCTHTTCMHTTMDSHIY